MNYAWVIDQTRCIGCHACSTACKSENDVPLGVYRTWVKNVEVGTFPNVRRHFAVLRCNHCADPPCVHICPVRAMYQRSDGIVDIDHDRCIGCKACMQACPYDAIHVDPDDNTAAKCHFCAHRVDRGLLPACVVVCPVEALVFGDLDDERARVSRITGSTPVTVRRPEQRTRPKAFYVGAHEATLDPLAATHEDRYMWADRRTGTAKDNAPATSLWPSVNGDGPTPARNGAGRTVRSRMPTARVAYDVPHAIHWRGKVSAYLWTKSIAAGAAFMAAVSLLGGGAPDTLHVRGAPLVAMIALAVTGVLLIADLKRPERFWFILLKPQWRSWLTRGAYIIAIYGALLAVWIGLPLVGRSPPALLLWLIAVTALAVAVYTAFLFGQCEGRDLWQSPLLLWTLAMQMIVAGSASLLLGSMWLPVTPEAVDWLGTVLLLSLVAHVVSVSLAEATAHHGSSNAAAAARLMIAGRYAPLFWGSVVVGTILPAVLLAVSAPGGFAIPVAAGLALGGLLAYEHAFVMAGQGVPIS